MPIFQSLNSILLEGTVTFKSTTDTILKVKVSKEVRDNNGERTGEIKTFEIFAKFAIRKPIMDKIQEGSAVRIVGQIDRDEDGIVIKAESVELRIPYSQMPRVETKGVQE